MYTMLTCIHNLLGILKNKNLYDDIEYITSKNLMTEVLNKYEVLINSVKWNLMSPEQDHILALNTVAENVKYDNLKINNSAKTTSIKIRVLKIVHSRETSTSTSKERSMENLGKIVKCVRKTSVKLGLQNKNTPKQIIGTKIFTIGVLIT